MIHVSRIRQGVTIEPSAGWFARARAATARAIAEGENHSVTTLYCEPVVRRSLEQLFSNKCAYCELCISGAADWNVEHYRPKNEVREDRMHPGYYWLAYEWNNLLLSCSHCNQLRIDRAITQDQEDRPAAGKDTQFPLLEGGIRGAAPGDDLALEMPALLNPCEDEPEQHIGFDLQGLPFAIGGSRRGEITIEVVHLRRRTLVTRRRDRIKTIIEIMRIREAASAAIRIMLDSLLEKFLASESDLASCARNVVNQPERFVSTLGDNLPIS